LDVGGIGTTHAVTPTDWFRPVGLGLKAKKAKVSTLAGTTARISTGGTMVTNVKAQTKANIARRLLSIIDAFPCFRFKPIN